jgi:ABC-type cobalamin/Fe3+-siderophores transport system ATPase subunit
LHIERFEEPRLPPHPWTGLSSGERQMLLFVVYTVCLLRDDAILLIDEPDLHIHVGMVKQLLDTLAWVAEKRRSQMIVAGHSLQLRDRFALRAEKVSLGPWRRGEP